MALSTPSAWWQIVGTAVGLPFTYENVGRATDTAYAAVCAYCKREFMSQERNIWLRPADDRVVMLPAPINSVVRICAGKKTLATVTNTDLTNQQALFALLESNARLSVINSAGALSTVVKPGFSIAALVAAINTVSADGWLATEHSSDLTLAAKPLAGGDALGRVVEIYGPGEPINGLDIDPGTGIVHGLSSYTDVYAQIDAGYHSAIGSFPDDLLQIIVELAVSIISSVGRDVTLQSEKIGNYSYTSASVTDLIAQRYAPRLDVYKRRPL